MDALRAPYGNIVISSNSHTPPLKNESGEKSLCEKILYLVKNIFLTIAHYLTCGWVSLPKEEIEEETPPLEELPLEIKANEAPSTFGPKIEEHLREVLSSERSEDPSWQLLEKAACRLAKRVCPTVRGFTGFGAELNEKDQLVLTFEDNERTESIFFEEELSPGLTTSYQVKINKKQSFALQHDPDTNQTIIATLVPIKLPHPKARSRYQFVLERLCPNSEEQTRTEAIIKRKIAETPEIQQLLGEEEDVLSRLSNVVTQIAAWSGTQIKQSSSLDVQCVDAGFLNEVEGDKYVWIKCNLKPTQLTDSFLSAIRKLIISQGVDTKKYPCTLEIDGAQNCWLKIGKFIPRTDGGGHYLFSHLNYFPQGWVSRQ